MAGYWAETVYGAAPLRDLERSDDSSTFQWLSARLPISGSKIDWERVAGRRRSWRIDDDASLVDMTIREVRRRIGPGCVVEHVGDSLSPYGVCFTADHATAVMTALLEIPEHHYFVASDRSWIVVATTEGDLDVLDRAGQAS